jgi:hypothetical protein
LQGVAVRKTPGAASTPLSLVGSIVAINITGNGSQVIRINSFCYEVYPKPIDPQ